MIWYWYDMIWYTIHTHISVFVCTYPHTCILPMMCRILVYLCPYSQNICWTAGEDGCTLLLVEKEHWHELLFVSLENSPSSTRLEMNRTSKRGTSSVALWYAVVYKEISDTLGWVACHADDISKANMDKLPRLWYIIIFWIAVTFCENV